MEPNAIFWLEVEKIKPNPYQPRRDFDQEGLEELAASIREYGILEPLIVARQEKEVPGGKETEYQLLAGERRLMAAKLAGLNTVPAIIRANPEERHKLEIALTENIQRTDLNPLERARAFARLVDEFGLSQREVALRVGKSRETVANTLRLLSLPEEAQRALQDGRITEGHARAILAIDTVEKQRALLGEILVKNLNVREAEKLAHQFGAGGRPRPQIEVSLDPLSQELETKLEEVLGTKVSLRKYGEKGIISINFHSPEELDAIVSRICGGEL